LNAEWLFLCIVVIIGLSDIADGYIARKYHFVSKLGARLDSVSDLIFFAIILWIVYLKYEWILTDNCVWFLIIVFLKVSTAILSRFKNGEFAFIHTIANKTTGILVFLSILILPFGIADSLFTVVFIVAALAAAEEFGIVLLNKKVDLNQKSIFKS
jgi:CDP-alcohol phosphatidyltransferase.